MSNDPILERNVRELGLDFLALAIAEELKAAFGEALHVDERREEQTKRGSREYYRGTIDVACEPFYPAVSFELMMDRTRPVNGVYPVTLQVEIDYASALQGFQEKPYERLQAIQRVTNHLIVLLFLEGGLERGREDHLQMIAVQKRFTQRDDLDYLSTFTAIPEAIRYVSDGRAMEVLTRAWYQAMHQVAIRSAQETPTSVALTGSQP